MSKTIFADTPPTGTLVTAAFLNAVNNHRHTGADEDGPGALDYAVATGSTGSYAVALAPVLTAHVAGMPIRFKANHTNTGAATLAVNAMSAVALKRPNGAALGAGDIVSGAIVTVVYDGTNYQVLVVLPQAVAGDIVQVVNYHRNDVVIGSESIPIDDSLPQIGEGALIMTIAITPRSAANKLLVEALAFVAVNAGNGNPVIALFQDSISDALRVSPPVQSTGNAIQDVPLRCYMDAGGISAITFTVRLGAGGAAWTLNGANGSRLFGGALYSSITVTEIQA